MPGCLKKSCAVSPVEHNHETVVEARFYILDVPSSIPERLLGLLLGVRVHPSPPPLQVGVGARDGESMPLADLLARRLDG